ncbi:MAG TPA: DUF4412 domain-containing protein [Methylomirabilota bacterium]|nr:DUF4412 domain-containing protein [Methylomirabilota bacterium]
MRYLPCARWLVIALLLLLAPAADAGYALVDEGGHQTLISRGRLKIAPRDGDVSMVMDVGRGRMMVADAKRRLYWEGTVEQYCQEMQGAMAGAMAEMEKQMAEHLKDMPPAQRQQMEQMMRQMGRGSAAGAPAGPPPQVTVERTNETATIAGLAARKYRVLSNGTAYEEVWLTSDAALLREVEAGRAPDTLGRMSGCMASAGSDRPAATAEYRKLFAEGWPLKLTYLAGGNRGGTTVMTVERRDIPDTEFAVPTAYRAAPLGELFGTRGR